MIALKCPGCGHRLSLSDSQRGREVGCPLCRAVMTEDGSPRTTVQAAPARRASSPSAAVTPVDTRDDETLAPPPSSRADGFGFLAPAQSSEDLGWLAHFRVVRLLGQGGMGIVFEAVDTHLQRTVALKVMKPEIAQDELARQRFLREARATAAVKSDHIVIIHHVSQGDLVPYLAMEFLHGEPLDRWLREHGQPSVEQTLRIGIEIARGLEAAHGRGLIHRDIKPSNIWLEAAPGRVKILDFGLARQASDASNLTQTGHVLGTPAYMAPEQAELGAVDARSDLFSLGCVLYELASGVQPFTGKTMMAVLMAVTSKDPPPLAKYNPDLPDEFIALIGRLLAKKPADRPQSARETAKALEAIADDYSARPRPAQVHTRARGKAALAHSDLVCVRSSGKRSRGVFATRPIKKGTPIESVPVLLVPIADIVGGLNNPRLKDVFYLWNQTNIAVSLGYGSLYQHSATPNAAYTHAKDTMTFRALRDIAEGEEITIDYDFDASRNAPFTQTSRDR